MMLTIYPFVIDGNSTFAIKHKAENWSSNGRFRG